MECGMHREAIQLYLETGDDLVYLFIHTSADYSREICTIIAFGSDARRELGEGAQAPEEQPGHGGLERGTGELWPEVGKHGSNQGSGKALLGSGQGGSGHQHVQEHSAIRRGI